MIQRPLGGNGCGPEKAEPHGGGCFHVAAQRARFVGDVVCDARNLGVEIRKQVADALDILTFSTKKGSDLVRKVLESAIANAENNEAADVDDLVVSEIFVNEGFTMKRIQPPAKGRADRIFKRTCHVTVTVSDETGA